MEDGVLTTFNMSVHADFSVSDFASITGDLVVSYAAGQTVTVDESGQLITITAPSELTITGQATAQFLERTVSVELGGGGTQGLVIENGQLASFDMTVSGEIGIPNAIDLVISATATYTASDGEFTLSGSGSLDVQVPSFLQFAMGNTLVLASVGFNVVDIPGDNADSYFQIYTTVLDTSVGIQVNFNGDFSLNPGVSVLQGIENLANDAVADIKHGLERLYFVVWPIGWRHRLLRCQRQLRFRH